MQLLRNWNVLYHLTVLCDFCGGKSCSIICQWIINIKTASLEPMACFLAWAFGFETIIAIRNKCPDHDPSAKRLVFGVVNLILDHSPYSTFHNTVNLGMLKTQTEEGLW